MAKVKSLKQKSGLKKAGEYGEPTRFKRKYGKTTDKSITKKKSKKY